MATSRSLDRRMERTFEEYLVDNARHQQQAVDELNRMRNEVKRFVRGDATSGSTNEPIGVREYQRLVNIQGAWLPSSMFKRLLLLIAV